MTKHAVWCQLEIETKKIVKLYGNVPVWGVTKLGKEVKLLKPFMHRLPKLCRTWPAGTIGTLYAIQTSEGGAVADVLLPQDGRQVHYEIPFDDLVPVDWPKQ